MTHMKDGKRKMRFGDARGNVHPAQTMICTIFIKNHNDIAENLGKCFVLICMKKKTKLLDLFFKNLNILYSQNSPRDE